MNFLRLLFIGFIAIACSTQKESVYQKLQGHWHATLPHNIYYTLDVTDSIATINKFSFIGETESFPLFYDSAEKISLPDICRCQDVQRCVPFFHISNDTLYYDYRDKDECSISKLVKSDIVECQWNHAVENPDLDLSNLPIQTGRILNWDSVRMNSSIRVIKVGLSKSKLLKQKEIAIETYPVVEISHENIYKKLGYIQDRFVLRAKRPASVCLVISESVRKSLADSLINSIPRLESVNILRLVKVKDSNELGYELLNQ